MDLPYVRTKIAEKKELIKVLEKEIETLRSVYRKAFAKFKVGDRVRCEGWVNPHMNFRVMPMIGTVSHIYISEECNISYAVRPDPDQNGWKECAVVFRNEDILQPASKVEIT